MGGVNYAKHTMDGGLKNGMKVMQRGRAQV